MLLKRNLKMTVRFYISIELIGVIDLRFVSWALQSHTNANATTTK